MGITDLEGVPPILQLQSVTCGYDSFPVVSSLSLSLQAGQICALLGPNGVGKTTLFKSILGSLPLISGNVLIQGRSINDLSPEQTARLVGYVPQAHTPPFPYTVAEVVEMGRTAHLGITAVPSRSDRHMALDALNRLGIAFLHDRPYTQISGGERQLVLIARALCQQPSLLVMDEPCASLDFGNRARVLGETRHLADEGLSVIMTTHDPDHALAIADLVVLLVDESTHAVGAPCDVLTPEMLQRAYGIPVAMGSVAGTMVAVALQPTKCPPSMN